jgi:uncharacterized Zn finger protein
MSVDLKYPDWIRKPSKMETYLREQQKKLAKTIKDEARQAFRVEGSKGNVYSVTCDKNHDNWGCTCPGFNFRGKCKHVSKIQKTTQGG